MKASVERLKEITSVLRKHNVFKDFNPTNVRLSLEDLGPTFIKMGQILASREDLIPKRYCDELALLRSNVKPMDKETIKNILEEEYDNFEDIFMAFDYNPIGSASIAEVHRAVLCGGVEVAVKIKRENISKMMKQDTDLIKRVIDVFHLNKLTGNIIDLKSVVDEMYESAKEEMDFTIEANHIKEFIDNNEDINYLKKLKVYNNISSSNILVMEYIKGININDSKELINRGYDLDEIGSKLAHNYIKQALDDGFYHADPHIDNFKIVDGKICYLDFGMMGRLTQHNRNLLIDAASAIVSDDINTLAHILVLMDTKKNDIDYMRLKSDISLLLERNKTTEIININIVTFTRELMALLQANQITLPKDITLLIRGIIVLEGTLEVISPSINLIQVFKNYFGNKKILSKEEIKKFGLSTISSGKDLMSIPKETLAILEGINTGELRFNVEINDSKHQLDRIEEIVHLLMITALDVAFIIGTSSMVENMNIVFYIYMSGAVICTIWLIYKLIISRFRK